MASPGEQHPADRVTVLQLAYFVNFPVSENDFPKIKDLGGISCQYDPSLSVLQMRNWSGLAPTAVITNYTSQRLKMTECILLEF